MYFLLKMGTFQPAMLVYQRVTFMESKGFPSVFDRRPAMLNDRSQSPSHVRRTNGPWFDPRVEVRCVEHMGIAGGGNWTNWIAKRRCFNIIEGSLEVKLPTIWTVEKAEQSSRVRR